MRTTMELGTYTLEAPEALAVTSTTTTETIVPPTGETKFIVHSVTIYVFKYIYYENILSDRFNGKYFVS
jgi:hypothetical protein